MGMPDSVFVYGTLCAPEVVHVLLHRAPKTSAAVLRGYKRQCIRQQVFPALVPSDPAASVKGWVLSGLSPKEMVILDEYEDVDYYRTTVSPTLEDGSEVDCEVYVWKEDRRHLLIDVDWDYDRFRKDHLASYLKMSQEFLEEYMAEIEAATPNC
mmetsp:Transcript_4819/g.13857  ORF Transcript_4819/g.13857 Transcript_4819/m.13857 type:complete len:154 (-) Transcript_4819:441-902(-)|eukprot:CAMPEP_0206136616 /NCGR_PEP_ID=MMETSP1473-20131121/1857_1 /ASSEMBLY_ACC=CAM_ASM_001109 /TAXON_ID=1461547 /ORGANISM="Stichococcus sp, Strain RCC1054" /LENGTH=153 /DNA_ID=CAMNT_0053529289 /DNA_START=154 /DNA_END=615 /DNA_ORIENTATION=-